MPTRLRPEPSYLIGLIGDGVVGSLSPALHEREAARLGLRYVYKPVDLAASGLSAADLPTLLTQALALGFDGFNVTYPYKQAILPHLEAIDEQSRRIGAVNVLVRGSAGWIGCNTDVTGFRSALARTVGDGGAGSVVQLGAGGAGSATAYAALDLGADRLLVCDTDAARATALVGRLAPYFPGAELRAIDGAQVHDAVATACGVVNATPVGMDHSPGLPFDVTELPSGAWVADVVYRPTETALVRLARARGHRVVDGGQMVVEQAADGMRIFADASPDRDRMRDHFLQLTAATRTQ
ncbi:shikimate dehydrogenase [Microtetraspora sp. AC03309]|uniref:shikimate dehydrogenase n=1 Tax=Microtetraspora sp. AC03309 TaxID=2779376 RepID=UPI001E4C57AE|nr:shikimate dehydrogenase [Microtetraspora sp. AC03309]